MQEIVARLQITAITTMLFTRLARSANSATGIAPSATVTETTETSAPSCLSEGPQSAFNVVEDHQANCHYEGKPGLVATKQIVVGSALMGVDRMQVHMCLPVPNDLGHQYGGADRLPRFQRAMRFGGIC